MLHRDRVPTRRNGFDPQDRRALRHPQHRGNVVARGLDTVIAPGLGNTNVIGMNLLSRLASWRVEGQTLILVPNNPQPVVEAQGDF